MVRSTSYPRIFHLLVYDGGHHYVWRNRAVPKGGTHDYALTDLLSHCLSWSWTHDDPIGGTTVLIDWTLANSPLNPTPYRLIHALCPVSARPMFQDRTGIIADVTLAGYLISQLSVEASRKLNFESHPRPSSPPKLVNSFALVWCYYTWSSEHQERKQKLAVYH